MSDIRDTDDPVMEMLTTRRAELLRQADDINVRISEIDAWMNVLTDGRSRLSRARRRISVPSLPADSEPAPALEAAAP